MTSVSSSSGYMTLSTPEVTGLYTIGECVNLLVGRWVTHVILSLVRLCPEALEIKVMLGSRVRLYLKK